MAASWLKVFESGNLMFGGGIYEAAFKKYAEALELAISAGDQSWIGDSTRAMARTYLAVGKLEEAEQLALQAEQVDRAFWGCENQQVADDIFIQAEAKLAKGLLGEARAKFDHTLAIRMDVLGEDHDDTLTTLIRLMWIDLEDGVSQHALLAHMSQASAVFARLHPYGSFAKALNIHKLLRRYIEQEKLQEANNLVERLLRAMRAVFGNTHPEITQILADCSDVQQDSNKQLAAWRLKTRSEVMNRATSENVWLAQMEGKNNPNLQTGNNTAYGAPTFQPTDEIDKNFLDGPAYANKPTVFQVQPNQFSQPNAPAPPDPFALPVPSAPDPFAPPSAPSHPNPLAAPAVPLAAPAAPLPPNPFAQQAAVAPPQTAVPASPPAPQMPPQPAPVSALQMPAPQMPLQPAAMPLPPQPAPPRPSVEFASPPMPAGSVVVANLNPVKPVAPAPSQFREELSALGAAAQNAKATPAQTGDIDSADDEDETQYGRMQPASLQSRSAVHAMPQLPVPIYKRSLLDTALARAGFEMPAQKFGHIWLVLASVMGALSALVYIVSGYAWLCVQAFMLGFVLGTSAVVLFLSVSIARHQSALAKNLPDALEIMVSELRQGVPFADTLVFLSQTGPISMRREFVRAVKAMESGKSVKDAMAELAYYVRAPEVRQLADRVKASQSTGQGLAESVSSIAKSCRDRQSSRGNKGNDGTKRTLALIIGGCLICLPAIRLIIFPSVGVVTFSSMPGMVVLTIVFGVCMFASISFRSKGQEAWAISAEQTTEKFLERCSRGKVAGELRKELVDFLDLVIMYTESGVSVPQAVQQVSQNSTSSCPILCTEIQRTIADMKSFKSAVPNAFRSIGKQYGVEELITLGGTLEAAERTKSSVSHQLREQSKALKSNLKYSSGARGLSGLIVLLLILYLIARRLGF